MAACWVWLHVLLLLVYSCLIARCALPVLYILPALCTLSVLRVLHSLLQLGAFAMMQIGLELPLLVLTLRAGAAMLIGCIILVLAMVLGAPVQVDLCSYPEPQQSATLISVQVTFPMV